MAGVHWRNISGSWNRFHSRRRSGVPTLFTRPRDRCGSLRNGSNLLRCHDFLRAGKLLEVKEVPVVKLGAYKSYTDPELVAMCLQGDSRAWEVLIRRYRRFIFSIPIKFGFSDSDSSDVFQGVCLKLLEHLHDLKDDRKVSTWLATTTTRQCLAMRTLKQRESGTEEETVEPEDPAGTLEEIKLLAERYQLLRDSVEKLPPRCRTMIEMLYLDTKQPSYEEIAERLGMPVPSVGPIRARCLDRLRMILRKSGIKK